MKKTMTKQDKEILDKFTKIQRDKYIMKIPKPIYVIEQIRFMKTFTKPTYPHGKIILKDGEFQYTIKS